MCKIAILFQISIYWQVKFTY